MELVPILSTIILVGTIATFILAVAAYILYKIREGRAQEKRSEEQQVRPEPHVLVAPQQRPALASQPYRQEEPTFAPGQQPEPARREAEPRRQQGQRSAYAAAPPQQPQQPRREPPRQESLFWEYTDEGFVPVRPDDTPSQEAPRDENENDDGFAWL